MSEVLRRRRDENFAEINAAEDGKKIGGIQVENKGQRSDIAKVLESVSSSNHLDGNPKSLKNNNELVTKKCNESIKNSQEKVENIESLIETRKKRALESLKEMGLKNLDAYRNMKPRNKILMGIAFAGASVATGGLTSIITKGLSAASYSRGFYESILKAEERKGTENINKEWLAARSVAYGTIMALGTSALISEIASHVHVDTNGLMNSASEKFTAVKDSVKSLFGLHVDHVVAITSPDLVNTTSKIVESTTVTPPLPVYTVSSGDNLTKIIKDHVISKIPGTEHLTNFQKENMVQNLLNTAKNHPDNPLFKTINQFANTGKIMTGQMLDLNSIKESLTTDKLNGETLFNHAKSVIESSTQTTHEAVQHILPHPNISTITDSTHFSTEKVAPVSQHVVDTSSLERFKPENLNNVVDNKIGSVPLSYEQFTNKLSSGGSIISKEFNTYFQKNFDTIPDKDILKIKSNLLDHIMNGKDEAMKKIFEGKTPGDLKISSYLGNVELTVDSQNLVGASFKPSGLIDVDLHKNGLAGYFNNITHTNNIDHTPIAEANHTNANITHAPVSPDNTTADVLHAHAQEVASEIGISHDIMTAPISTISGVYKLENGDTIHSILNRVMMYDWRGVPGANHLTLAQRKELIDSFIKDFSEKKLPDSTGTYGDIIKSIKEGKAGDIVQHIKDVKVGLTKEMFDKYPGKIYIP